MSNIFIKGQGSGGQSNNVFLQNQGQQNNNVFINSSGSAIKPPAPITYTNTPAPTPAPQPNLIQQAENGINQAGSFLSQKVDELKNVPVLGGALEAGKSVVEAGAGIAKQLPQVPGYVEQAVKHPVETIGGVGASILEFGGSVGAAIQQGLVNEINNTINTAKTNPAEFLNEAVNSSNLVMPNIVKNAIQTPQNPAIQVTGDANIAKQTEAFKQLVNDYSKSLPQDQQKAFATGQFLGNIIPYTLGGELTDATLGAKILTPVVGKILPQVVKFIPTVSDAISFIGIGQVEHDNSTDGSRIDQLKNDLTTLAVFKLLDFSVGAAKGVVSKDTKATIDQTVNQVSDQVQSGKAIPFEETASQVQDAKQAFYQDTGESPQVVLAQAIKNGTVTPTQEIKVLNGPLQNYEVKTDINTGIVTLTPVDKGVNTSATLESNGRTINQSSSTENNPEGNTGQTNLNPQNQLQSTENSQYPSVSSHNGNETNPGSVEGNVGLQSTNTSNAESGSVATEPGTNPDNRNIPQEQLKPVGTGETRTSTLAAKVASSLKEKYGDLPQYQKTSWDEQARMASDIITQDPKRAERIALGQEAPPEGVLSGAVFDAVEKQAIRDGNYGLLRDLAQRSDRSLEYTRYGQEIGILSQRDPSSPVDAIKQVSDARAAEVQKKTGKPVTEAVTSEAKKIKEKVKVPDKNDWGKFIDSLKC